MNKMKKTEKFKKQEKLLNNIVYDFFEMKRKDNKKSSDKFWNKRHNKYKKLSYFDHEED